MTAPLFSVEHHEDRIGAAVLGRKFVKARRRRVAALAPRRTISQTVRVLDQRPESDTWGHE